MKGPNQIQYLLECLVAIDHIIADDNNERKAILFDIGSEMRRIREDKGMSVRALARKLGCSGAHLSCMELGDRTYSLERCQKAIEILDKK